MPDNINLAATQTIGISHFLPMAYSWPGWIELPVTEVTLEWDVFCEDGVNPEAVWLARYNGSSKRNWERAGVPGGTLSLGLCITLWQGKTYRQILAHFPDTPLTGWRRISQAFAASPAPVDIPLWRELHPSEIAEIGDVVGPHGCHQDKVMAINSGLRPHNCSLLDGYAYVVSGYEGRTIEFCIQSCSRIDGMAIGAWRRSTPYNPTAGANTFAIGSFKTPTKRRLVMNPIYSKPLPLP